MNAAKKNTLDYKAPSLEVRKRLLGSKGRSKYPAIKAARARLHAIHLVAQRHGWHNTDPVEIREACHALDRAMHEAGFRLRALPLGKGLRDNG